MATLLEHENILNVTLLEPKLKHSTIFERFDELISGESLILHNDHDPKPLFYELSAERGDIFEWEYLERGPKLWRIRITKTKGEGNDDENILDATLLHPSVKHQTIFNRFDALKPGESFTLHNDHDPRPLRFQLENTRGNVFNWEYLEQGPELFRIKITKNGLVEKQDENILDATLLHPSVKHQTIFDRFDALKPGESFTLHNDHDPRPLRFQLENTRGNIFNWEYLEQGPELFRIKITKNNLVKAEPEPAKASTVKENILNVTALEPKLKHPTIFVKFDELKPGESLTIHNDHDPKPLYYQLLGERGNIFTWEYLEQGPKLWRIKISKRPEGEGDETLGEIVAKDLRKAEIFKKYDLDFCCGGKKTVKEACAEKGLDVTKVEQELRNSDKTSFTARPLPYNDWNLDFLADYIVNTHHSYVRKTIPDIRSYAEKVAKVHGAHHPELLEINKLAQEVCDEMSEHMVKEETVLFPYVKHIVSTKGKGYVKFDSLENVQEPIDIAVTEHELVGGNMDKIKELSNNFKVPEDGCASYAYLFKTLNEFEDDLHIHIHLENNILFPKALKLEKE
ncbi:MAG: iron-sulfur cluster repair di-iron protein [Ginsengibacter sp.]